MARGEKTANERAPMCRICGHRHWNREPHVFTKSKSKTKPKGKRK